MPSEAIASAPMPATVKPVFDAYPEPARTALLALRNLVFETAAADPAIGRIEESLKWGQPAYRPVRPRTGSTLRMDKAGEGDGELALYFHCQTDLVGHFREIYPDLFRFEGNRAVLLDADAMPPRETLRHLIALTLTYHARKRAGEAA